MALGNSTAVAYQPDEQRSLSNDVEVGDGSGEATPAAPNVRSRVIGHERIMPGFRSSGVGIERRRQRHGCRHRIPVARRPSPVACGLWPVACSLVRYSPKVP